MQLYTWKDLGLTTYSFLWHSFSCLCSLVRLYKILLKNKLRSLHFTLLRPACRDCQNEYSCNFLSKICQRADPDEWSKFCTSSLVIKTIREKNPTNLHSLLMSIYFEEPRKAGLGIFFDKSNTKFYFKHFFSHET